MRASDSSVGSYQAGEAWSLWILLAGSAFSPEVMFLLKSGFLDSFFRNCLCSCSGPHTGKTISLCYFIATPSFVTKNGIANLVTHFVLQSWLWLTCLWARTTSTLWGWIFTTAEPIISDLNRFEVISCWLSWCFLSGVTLCPISLRPSASFFPDSLESLKGFQGYTSTCPKMYIY